LIFILQQIIQILRIENVRSQDSKLSEMLYAWHDARCISSGVFSSVMLRLGYGAEKKNQMVETFRRWRAKCNSTEIMFAAFTRTCLEEDAVLRPNRDSISRASLLSLLRVSWLKVPAEENCRQRQVPFVCVHSFVLSDPRGNVLVLHLYVKTKALLVSFSAIYIFFFKCDF